MIRYLKSLLVAAVAVAGLSGCGVDAALDCHAICNRYASCYDSGYDVTACETRCRVSADKDSDFKRKADICDACITDQSCASATWSCGVDCSSVVP